MEQPWTLQTPDGKTVYGVTNKAAGEAKGAIFVVHGLTGEMYDYTYKNYADKMCLKGWDVYRFNLYDWREGGRHLVDCTLRIHAQDLEQVVSHFRDAYEDIFLTGHSYGGPTVMLSSLKDIRAISLWDPSYDFKGMDNVEKCGDYYISPGSVAGVYGKAMYGEAQTLTEVFCDELAQKWHSPMQVIFAENGYYVTLDKSYHSECTHETETHIIQNTIHCFYEGKTNDELVKLTDAWFSKFIKETKNV